MLFTVEVDEEWLDALDSLIQTTLGSAKADIIGGSMLAPFGCPDGQHLFLVPASAP